MSFERRLDELKKILTLSNFELLSIQKKIGKFLELSLGCKFDFNGFITLCRLERMTDDVSFERRVKYLTRKREVKKFNFFRHLDRKTQQRINNKIDNKNFLIKNILFLLYEIDKELVIDHIMFATVKKKITKVEFLKLFKEIQKFKKRRFPISGVDLKKVGFKEGKKIGNALIETKKWWVENNFHPLKNQCIKFAVKFLPPSSGG